jgi:copper homeostasis protein
VEGIRSNYEGICFSFAMTAFLLELCVESLEAAQAAETGGANRIELCADLGIGGVTPPIKLTESVVQALAIPVHVLIRARGGDFVFSAEEFCLMRRQIEQVKAAGAAGVAIGVLLADGRVDVERSRQLAELARPMKVTFHRAFDETPDLSEALEAVIGSSADCLLTSGGAPDVQIGAQSIAQLCQEAGGRLDVMAGGGLKLANLTDVLQRTGVRYLHGSLKRRQPETTPDTQTNGHRAVEGPSLLEADVREAVRMIHEEVSAQEIFARVTAPQIAG